MPDREGHWVNVVPRDGVRPHTGEERFKSPFTFPRTNDTGHKDDGKLVNKHIQYCPKCGSRAFKETVSTEFCRTCGYKVDYWRKADSLHGEALKKVKR